MLFLAKKLYLSSGDHCEQTILNHRHHSSPLITILNQSLMSHQSIAILQPSLSSLNQPPSTSLTTAAAFASHVLGMCRSWPYRRRVSGARCRSAGLLRFARVRGDGLVATMAGTMAGIVIILVLHSDHPNDVIK